MKVAHWYMLSQSSDGVCDVHCLAGRIGSTYDSWKHEGDKDLGQGWLHG